MSAKTANVSKEACAARLNFQAAVDFCYETLANPQEHEIARSLKDEAFDAMVEICGHSDNWTHIHEQEFLDSLRYYARKIFKQ